MVCVSTISVFGLFGSTLPNSLRAMPGLKSLVSFESITNCSTFPSGTPSTFLRSGAGTYFGPMTKLSYGVERGVLALFQHLERRGALVVVLAHRLAANKPEHARAAIRLSAESLYMKTPR